MNLYYSIWVCYIFSACLRYGTNRFHFRFFIVWCLQIHTSALSDLYPNINRNILLYQHFNCQTSICWSIWTAANFRANNPFCFISIRGFYFKFTTRCNWLDVRIFLLSYWSRVKGARAAWLLCETIDIELLWSPCIILFWIVLWKMVQDYVSPVRVHKHPFEMVMAVSITWCYFLLLCIFTHVIL